MSLHLYNEILFLFLLENINPETVYCKGINCIQTIALLALTFPSMLFRMTENKGIKLIQPHERDELTRPNLYTMSLGLRGCLQCWKFAVAVVTTVGSAAIAVIDPPHCQISNPSGSPTGQMTYLKAPYLAHRVGHLVLG